jgi:hypothetical protein
MNAPRLLLAALFATFMLGCSIATQPDTALATSGAVSVSAAEHRALHFKLGDDAYRDALSDEAKIRLALGELLMAKQVKAQRDLVGPATPLESTFLELSGFQANLASALIVVEQRARRDAEANRDALEKRAREIYLSTEPPGGKRELSADFQQILFDLRRRGFDETSKRVAAALKALADGAEFDQVV